MKEAMEEVKNELGRDAVILHTKKYREGGFLGYHSKDVVEVTAAIEDAPSKSQGRRAQKVNETEEMGTASQAKSGERAVPVFPANILNQYKTNGTQAGVDLVSPPLEMPSFEPRHAYQEIEAGSEAGNVLEEDTAGERFPEPVAALGAEREAREKEPEEKAAELRMQQSKQEDTEKIQKLEAELSQMKTLLAQVMSKDMPQDEISLQEALRSQEVDEEILRDMAAKSAAGDTLIDSLDPKAKDILADYLDKVVNFSEGIQLNRHGVRIVSLIGATGVGKTTTLAKIAARFVLEKGIKAALITADTYRISAVEQLKTYSDIIGLPLEIVYSPDELKVAIHKHKDKDLVLIDTAGRSQHNDYQMKELQDFLAVDGRIEKHLVMSATTKERDAEDILEKFSVCRPDRVIFTKTDETSSVGLILNLLSKRDIAISFLTNGQSVPDDIIPATPAELARLLLRV